MFNYKGITSQLTFGIQTDSNLKKIIDVVYDYFKIINVFPSFEIIIHPDHLNNKRVPPETRNGLILLSTNICDYGQYDYYEQITWQFSHELVHACKGFIEGRVNWIYLPDNDEEEILAGGIAISITKDLCPTYDYTIDYDKTNLKQCEEKAKYLPKLIL